MIRYLLSMAEEDVLTMIIEQEKRIGPGRSESLPTDRYNPIVLKDIVTELERKGYVTSTCDLSSAGAMLTQKGRDYFEIKESNWKMTILKGETRELLVELIEKKGSNLASFLATKFVNLSHSEDSRLRATIKHLIDSGFLRIPNWADNVPYVASLTYKGEHYLELEKDELSKNSISQGNTITIETLNAQGGNLFIGNSSSVTQNIDRSVHNIEIMIEEKGGEDKEVLNRLLAEAKIIAERISQKESLPENSGFFQRAGEHFKKHSWFYGAIVQLIGTAIISRL